MGTNQNVKAWGILALLAVIWGSSFILIKYGLEHFSPAQVGSMRIAIAFLFLMPFALVKIKLLKRKDLGWLFVSGLIGNFLPSLLFAYAEQVVSSSVAGILNSLTPIFTLIVATTLFKRTYSFINIAGVFLGLTGAIGLLVATNGGVVDIRIGYSLLVVLATIFYAINLNIIKNKLPHLHPVNITSFAFFLVGPIALIHLLFFTPLPQNITAPEAGWGILYIGLLAVVGTALALMLFNRLILQTNVIFASSVTYLIPVVAIIAGVLDGEIFKPGYLLWITIILIGIFMVNKVVKKQKSI